MVLWRFLAVAFALSLLAVAGWFWASAEQRDQLVSLLTAWSSPAFMSTPPNPSAVPLPDTAIQWEHRKEESEVSACAWVRVPNPSKRHSQEIYRWTDARGQTHFSDRPPDKGTRSRRLTDFRADDDSRFSLELAFHGLRELPGFRDAVDAGTQRIHRFLEQQLGQGSLAPLHVKLSLIQGKRHFERYRVKLAPRTRTNSGFYLFRKNLAVVRNRKDVQHTLAVAHHEVTHLILGNLFGDLDTWLNEGLAEFFERLRIEGQSATVAFDRRSYRRLMRGLKNPGLPELDWFMKSNYRQWKQRDIHLMYAYAWSLIHYLMSSHEGEAFLGSVLREQRQRRCEGFSTAAFFQGHYPGGLAGLARGWRGWMTANAGQSLYY